MKKLNKRTIAFLSLFLRRPSGIYQADLDRAGNPEQLVADHLLKRFAVWRSSESKRGDSIRLTAKGQQAFESIEEQAKLALKQKPADEIKSKAKIKAARAKIEEQRKAGKAARHANKKQRREAKRAARHEAKVAREAEASERRQLVKEARSRGMNDHDLFDKKRCADHGSRTCTCENGDVESDFEHSESIDE